MKKFIIGMVVLLLSIPAVRAEVVIDDFSGNPSTLLDNFTSPPLHTPNAPLVNGPTALDDAVAGARTITVGSGSRVSFGNNAFGYQSQRASTTASLSYVLSSAIRLSAAPGGGLLVDLFRNVQGSYNIDVQISSTAGGGTFNFATFVLNSASKGPRIFDGSLVPVAIRNAVDGITVSITRDGTTGFRSFSAPTPNARIAAVPEPASMILLSVTGLGGAFVARRRMKAKNAA